MTVARRKPPIKHKPKETTMNEVEIIDSENRGGLLAQVGDLEVDQETRIALCKTFEPLYSQASEWAEKASAIIVKSSDDKVAIKAAHDLRINLKNLRVASVKLHKEKKADALLRGRAVDGMLNIIKLVIVPMEEHLQNQEDFAKREREKEVERLQGERSALLYEYEFDPKGMGLGEMAEDSFQGLLSTARIAFDARAQKAKEEQKRIDDEAERQRLQDIEDEKERELMISENARLKKEQAVKDAELKLEREQREKERQALEDKQTAERKKGEAAEKIRKANADKKLKAVAKEKADAIAEVARLQEVEKKRKLDEQNQMQAEKDERQKEIQAANINDLREDVDALGCVGLKSDIAQKALSEMVDYLCGILHEEKGK